MDAVSLPYFEVDVPIHDSSGRSGVHIFTGPADSRTTAVRLAHEVYDEALAARKAGHAMPGKRPDGWGARGVRLGWELDWQSAAAGRWNDPYSRTRTDNDVVEQ